MAAAKFFFLSEMIMECLSTVFDLCKINTYLQHTKGNLISNPTWILDINVFPVFLILAGFICMSVLKIELSLVIALICINHPRRPLCGF